MSAHKILVGSKSFFSSLDGFRGTDTDYLVLEDNPKNYKYYYQISKLKEDVFYWNRNTILDYDYSKTPMAIGKFLVPEVLSSLGLEFKDVEGLIENHVTTLDKKHEYLKEIFKCYKKNNSMVLTNEQLIAAYKIYSSNG